MPVRLHSPRGRRRPAPRACLSVELLESRLLLSGTPLPAPVLEITPTNTLDLSAPVQVAGDIGSGPAGAADVDWYTFTLGQASAVTFSASPQSGQADPVVSLYNNDPFDFNDLYDPLGHRLLAQSQGGPGGPTTLTEELAPGTYFVAISGAGNLYFNPLLAGSGYPGSTGAYNLQVTTTGLGLDPRAGPVVLSTTPGTDQSVNDSPLVLRVDLSGSIDPNTVLAGQTVNLLYSPTPVFDAGSTVVPLNWVSYSDQIAELQLQLAQALAPGYYEIVLSGNSQGNTVPVLADLSGNSINNGQDYTAVFQVTGIDGVTGAVTSDDTAATAHDLGNVTGTGLVQVTGAIGSDPAYSFSAPFTDSPPYLFNPAAQVNLYKFEVSGPGNYAFASEVFAGRIGSPLDPGLSLFSVDASGHLNLVASNDNTLNTAQAIDGSQPLLNDPALFDGLTQGTYYLAVSGTGNVPDPNPAAGMLPGANGIFDPNVSQSGANGFTTGDYVLNLAVQPSYTTPRVTSVTVRTDTNVNATTGAPAAGAQLDAPPTVFEVQFNEPVNLQQLYFQATQQNPSAGLNAVYVTVPATGTSAAETFYPRLLNYDPLTGLAQFLMLDAVPNGPYAQGQTPALHLSGAGPDGITDMAGNPLAGGGEVVIPFTVNGPVRGTNGNPLLWTSQEPNDSLDTAQPLGTLFANELHSQVVLQRNLSATATDTADYYSFSVLQSRDYLLSITGTGLPAYNPAHPTTPTTPAPPFAIYSVALQKWITGSEQGNTGTAFLFSLTGGQYIVKVGDWSADPTTVSYRLSLGLANSGDSLPPLTLGPAPAIRLIPAREPTLTTPPTAEVRAADDAPGGLSLLAASPSATLVGLLPAAEVPLTTTTDTNTAAGILLVRAASPVGVRGANDDAETTEVAANTGAAARPALLSLLALASVTASDFEGAEEEELVAAPAPGPGAGPGRSNPIPGAPPAPLVPSPREASPEPVAGGMPARAAQDALFELGLLRTDLAGVVAAYLPNGLPARDSGFAPPLPVTPLPSGERGNREGAEDVSTRKRLLDVFILASLGASITLGGWCTVRLHRRPAGGPMRICWGGEDSTDFPEQG